ncbi:MULTISPECIES: efflux RND transporter periplasmic adaptor subunit [Arenibacter]|uniref:efflux RND transporter periplasmic adaptor subunit n=1 Tax=Arenibacter TaxID=178469 RepID=UPI001C07B384|nr:MULTISPECIES: efflux RND transporter periplasmic adaptor subunit [Arenibacter]MBU2906262.1 efflux RND transporter periplasmic adaptor subunit [Arenibacter algicola]MCK0135131.1 efflux RND transporter periplasmic adaptor subunit [Arenibacter sp. S6351L]
MRNFILIYCLFLLLSCGDKQEKIFPTKIHLTESVYASVTVQPDSLYQAYAPVAGILDRNLLEEGDLVSQGTPIIQIVNSTPKLNTENARLTLELAQANYNGSSAVLSSLEDEIQSATLSFKNDSMNYLRQKRLWDQNIGSKVEFENRKLAYEISGNSLKQLKNKYVQTKNELSTQVQQALNNYNTSQISTKDFTVSSKINGKVYALYKNPGEIVNTMEPLASVGSATDFIIELLIDEVDIVKLQLGQKALITLDAYGDEVFDAKVSKIYPKKDERSQTFKAEAIFNNPPKALYPGLAGEGNIIISEKESVLTIPKEFLLEGNKVKTPDGLVEVVPGLQNLDRVEIIKGINESTEILKPEE